MLGFAAVAEVALAEIPSLVSGGGSSGGGGTPQPPPPGFPGVFAFVSIVEVLEVSAIVGNSELGGSGGAAFVSISISS